MKCRHCGNELEHSFLDLGFAPPSNAYLSAAQLNQPEVHLPLRVKVCSHCWLVQTEDFVQADALFSPSYAYFSSTSLSWLEHSKKHALGMIEQLKLDKDSFVIELASNDGYLLKNFKQAGIPCLGIEPTDATAEAAEKIGIPVIRKFFGQALANELDSQGQTADLIIGNNVYAHVPDINDFTLGMKTCLKTNGTITLEFPHLLKLIENTQFDTVYHEHFSYLSLTAVTSIFERAGLKIYRVEEITTHGGSLRVYGCHQNDAKVTEPSVNAMIKQEQTFGLQGMDVYLSFQSKIDTLKNNLVSFLIEQKNAGKTVYAFGAAAKGNTLLNYAGVRPDLLPLVVDSAKSKQNLYMPGSHIPIVAWDDLQNKQPDYFLILPWNIAPEIKSILSDYTLKGGQLLVAVPELKTV